ncbi:EAL domain-containing protein [Lebetimonas sp. JS085]|uniref:EAL domain-containing protein n=1 Tax=Lebetimonas sp. JS085 TaxID=931222 RepID=UPI0004631A04|nr:EAL domain-containing protein [Lebetimonas sp. JS085]
MKLSKQFKIVTYGIFFVTIFVFLIVNIFQQFNIYKEEVSKETKKYIQIEKSKLKEKVDLFAEQFEYILNNVNAPKKHKIEAFKKIIENYNKHHLDKYIFIDSEKGGILVYPDSKLLGINLLKSNNEKLRKLKEMLIKASHSKEHFIVYEWINPKTGKKELKISYVRHIKHSPYFIGSGIFLNDINKIKNEIKNYYLNEFLDSMVLFLLLILLLTALFYVLLKNIENKLKNDLTVFEKYVKKEKIYKNKIYFEEFRNLAVKIIKLLKEKSKLLKNIEYKTYFDELTSLPNKLKLEKDLKKLNPKGSMIVDIKNFSLINDYYSIEVGDMVLKNLAKNLKNLLPDNCKLYRYSADEFIVLNFGEILCKELVEKIFSYFKYKIIDIKYKNEEIPINIELIMAIIKDGNKENIIKKLHLALLYAKKNDLNIVFYNEKMDIEEKVIKKFESIEMVKKALTEDRIIPVFQKIIKPDKISYECLVRIKEKDRLISPFFFLDNVKNTALYFEITKTMIRKSCEVFKNRREDFSINFSYKDLHNDKIKRYLKEHIEKYNLQGRVIIELLETEAMEDFKEVIKFIKEMKPYGIKTAIDDFGTGYSNFSYLADIHPDYIKIDGSLIKTINKNKRYYTIVKHVNYFAHDLGIKTIAEFVHNKEVYDVLVELGIDGFQGYYIEEPREVI